MVNNQKKKREIICYGTKTTNQNYPIQGAVRRRWIYVGKIAGKQVTEVDIKDFLKDVDGNDQIMVKKLNTLGQNSAFRIGLPSEKSYNEVSNATFWPEGVMLRDFTFDNRFFRRNGNDQN